LWAAIAVLAVALGGAGWYLTQHRWIGARPSEGETPTHKANGQTSNSSGQEQSSDGPHQVNNKDSVKIQDSSNSSGDTHVAKPSVDAKKVSAHIALGDFHFNRGAYDEALREYQEGLKLDPANKTLKDKIARAERAKAAEQRLPP